MWANFVMPRTNPFGIDHSSPCTHLIVLVRTQLVVFRSNDDMVAPCSMKQIVKQVSGSGCPMIKCFEETALDITEVNMQPLHPMHMDRFLYRQATEIKSSTSRICRGRSGSTCNDCSLDSSS